MALTSTGQATRELTCMACSTVNPVGPGDPDLCSNCHTPLVGEAELSPQSSVLSPDDPLAAGIPGASQNPAIAKRGYAEAMRFLKEFGAPGEEIEYIVTASPSSKSGATSCAVITSHRMLTCKMVGMEKPLLDDCLWQDVHDIKMLDTQGGVNLVVTTVQDGQLLVEGLPKYQAQVIIGYGLMHSERMRGGKSKQGGASSLPRPAPSPRSGAAASSANSPASGASPREGHTGSLADEFGVIAPFVPPGASQGYARQTDAASATPLPVTDPQQADPPSIESLMQRQIQTAAPAVMQSTPSSSASGASLLQSIMRASQAQATEAAQADDPSDPTIEPSTTMMSEGQEADLPTDLAVANEPAPPPGPLPARSVTQNIMRQQSTSSQPASRTLRSSESKLGTISDITFEPLSTPLPTTNSEQPTPLSDSGLFKSGELATTRIVERDLPEAMQVEAGAARNGTAKIEQQASGKIEPGTSAPASLRRVVTGALHDPEGSHDSSTDVPGGAMIQARPSQPLARSALNSGSLVSEPLDQSPATRPNENSNGPSDSRQLYSHGSTGSTTSGHLKAPTPSAPLRSRNSKTQEDLVQKMKQLRELLDIGLINDDEFAQKKAELLARF